MAGAYNPENEVPYFLWLGGLAIAVAVLLVVLRRWISTKMAGIR